MNQSDSRSCRSFALPALDERPLVLTVLDEEADQVPKLFSRPLSCSHRCVLANVEIDMISALERLLAPVALGNEASQVPRLSQKKLSYYHHYLLANAATGMIRGLKRCSPSVLLWNLDWGRSIQPSAKWFG